MPVCNKCGETFNVEEAPGALLFGHPSTVKEAVPVMKAHICQQCEVEFIADFKIPPKPFRTTEQILDRVQMCKQLGATDEQLIPVTALCLISDKTMVMTKAQQEQALKSYMRFIEEQAEKCPIKPTAPDGYEIVGVPFLGMHPPEPIQEHDAWSYLMTDRTGDPFAWHTLGRAPYRQEIVIKDDMVDHWFVLYRRKAHDNATSE